MPPPIRAPELSELETLTVCAAEGSMAAAAAALGISRPAVAKRVTSLEAIVGTPLLQRGTRGVRLTQQGAVIVARARRLLAERDALMAAIAELRQDGEEPQISGMRGLLGRGTASARAAQLPEALLAETERVLAVVFHASATGVVICDPDTGIVREANDAFCRFVGRPRSEVLGRPVAEMADWEPDDAEVHARDPDGSVRSGRVSSEAIELGGSPRLVTMVDAR